MGKVIFKTQFTLDKEEISTEDSGAAKIYSVAAENHPELFVRIQSWDETTKHKEFSQFVPGKSYKITIEEV